MQSEGSGDSTAEKKGRWGSGRRRSSKGEDNLRPENELIENSEQTVRLALRPPFPS